MEKLTQVFTRFPALPEYYLVVLAFFYGYNLPLSINPIALVLIIILTLQIIFKNTISGLIIAGLSLLINIYMLFALASKFSEFPTFNADALQFILVGLLLIGTNITVSGLMISKYLQEEAAK